MNQTERTGPVYTHHTDLNMEAAETEQAAQRTESYTADTVCS